MTTARTFRTVTATHAVSGDAADVHIQFLNRRQIEYRIGERRLIIDFEAFIKPNGVPEGSILDLEGSKFWSDGSPLTEGERIQLLADFQGAAAPFLTEFYLR